VNNKYRLGKQYGFEKEDRMFGFLRHKKVIEDQSLENILRRVVREQLMEFLGEPKKLPAVSSLVEVPPVAEVVVIPTRRGRKLGSKNKPRGGGYTPAQTPTHIPNHFSWFVTLKNKDTGIITNTTIDGVSEEAVNKTVKDSLGKTHEIISIEYKEKNNE
jgi:hypothetical protein